MNLFDLSNRVVVITGGNGGIGLGMAKGLAEAGASLSLWGRNAEKNAAAAKSLAGSKGRVETQVCDVADKQSVEDCFAATLKTFGRVDGVIANAGVSSGRSAPFWERSDEEWRRLFDINVDGVFYVFRAAAKHMVERAKSGDPYGRLVATSSLASLSGPARNEHYAATKAALNAICRSLAVELARYGVTANAILPGWTRSDMTDRAFNDPKFAGNVMPRIPMRRWGEPEDFAGIATYLMSKASSYHTADTFLIDGGYAVF
jgi:NAD(P)-dependent dehydrogenase (short-subunit alcohol dehydrogenase family)